MSQKKQSEKTTNRTTKKSKKVNKKKVFLIFITVMVLLGFIVGGAAVGIVVGIIKDADPIDAANIYDLLDESSFILDSEGQVLEKVQTTDYRSITDYSKMPPHLIDAFVAIEDERFWDHNGLDIKRIFGAAWTNLRTGSRQGASTINQQLAKNLYLTHEQTFTRKIQDMYYGIQLDRQLSKEQILEAYLNTIYLGSSAYGVQAASQVYFSKDVSELTIAESALIAGVTRNPSRYSPIRTLEKHQVDADVHHVLNDSDSIYTIVFNENTIPRQRLVLSIMRRLEMITESEYQAALQEDIKSSLKPNRLTADIFTSYFGDLVKEDVIKAFLQQGYSREEANNTLYSGGLRIYSTMDTKFQRILDEEFEKQSNFTDLQGRPLLTVGEDGNVQPQSAMVIMEPTTGEIKALIGGRGISGRKIYNRALNPRQPGSSIKPIAVYTPALDLGFTAATVIDDIPVYFDRNNPTRRYPNNHNNRYNGLITIREAIRDSSNVGAMVTIHQLANGNDNQAFNIMFEYMEKMGISTVVRPENPYIAPDGKRYSDATFSTALGGMTHGVSPLEMTAAFNSLANEGIYTEPITFTKITDRRGNLILENNSEKHRVVSPETAYILTDMLRTAVTSGTGSSAKFDQSNSRIPVAGKTGTTTNNKDAWFVGYTPYYVAATWVGYDTPDKLPGGGGRMAGTVWKNVMQRIHEELSSKNFEEPSDIVRRNVCNVSGKLPTEYCSLDPRGSRVRSEVFVRGTEPKDYCDVHVKADIHVPTGKLATEHTPPWEVESRVFIKRPVPYYPEAHGGIVPADYAYTLPKSHYDPLEDGGSFPPFGDDSTDGLIEDDGWLDDDLDPGTDPYEEPIDDTIIDSMRNN
ncbi:transglycosylase domain-containing protein [Clostridium formicaceticum]|uniref:Penicillin-binding protein 1A n=1 Tax=Clostridium formicaceticum TaxID=1497 RepID=A0AAC9WFY9_9CLOT|nr:PBP1A family penicillin-binding protein [Clostridium formicaceticum]AOY76769.1 penicillin-binding protein [Clostridium formicaceticum]ARE87224.1 Penicillin-binding protein 1F [Clostridium formicaceticum]